MGEKFEPGREYHKSVTGCEDLWEGLGPDEKRNWAHREGLLLEGLGLFVNLSIFEQLAYPSYPAEQRDVASDPAGKAGAGPERPCPPGRQG